MEVPLPFKEEIPSDVSKEDSDASATHVPRFPPAPGVGKSCGSSFGGFVYRPMKAHVWREMFPSKVDCTEVEMDCENSDSGSDMDLCSSEDEQSEMAENFLGDLPDLSSPTKTRVWRDFCGNIPDWKVPKEIIVKNIPGAGIYYHEPSPFNHDIYECEEDMVLYFYISNSHPESMQGRWRIVAKRKSKEFADPKSSCLGDGFCHSGAAVFGDHYRNSNNMMFVFNDQEGPMKVPDTLNKGKNKRKRPEPQNTSPRKRKRPNPVYKPPPEAPRGSSESWEGFESILGATWAEKDDSLCEPFMIPEFYGPIYSSTESQQHTGGETPVFLGYRPPPDKPPSYFEDEPPPTDWFCDFCHVFVPADPISLYLHWNGKMHSEIVSSQYFVRCNHCNEKLFNSPEEIHHHEQSLLHRKTIAQIHRQHLRQEALKKVHTKKLTKPWLPDRLLKKPEKPKPQREVIDLTDLKEPVKIEQINPPAEGELIRPLYFTPAKKKPTPTSVDVEAVSRAISIFQEGKPDPKPKRKKKMGRPLSVKNELAVQESAPQAKTKRRSLVYDTRSDPVFKKKPPKRRLPAPKRLTYEKRLTKNMRNRILKKKLR